MNAAVVIPVGSVEEVLSEQLMRVVGQNDAGLADVVLSVNASAADVLPRVLAIVESCGDKRVRIVDSSDRRGAAHARNVGAAATATEVIAFCDADDLVHDGWLRALVGALDRLDAVSGRTIDVFPHQRMANWYPPATPGGLNSFLGEPYLLTGNLAIKREAFEAVGGFDETLTRCEDIAISRALVSAGFSIGYTDEAAIDYRHREGVAPMLRQYYLYGRGMSEVLRLYGMSASDGSRSPTGLRMLRPNGQRAARRTVVGTMRRAALAAGRVHGLAVPRRLERQDTRVP